MRLRLTIAYDGRPFAGWQSQPGGKTVQDHIEAALGRILKAGQPVPVQGSGRTDAGVHAMGQVAHFDVPDGCRMDRAAWRRALNVHLPAAIRIMEVDEAAPGFHARFDASGKTYHYLLRNAEVLPPLEAGLVWHVPHRLDRTVLEAVSAMCEGRHDFFAFAANRGDGRDEGRDTVRTMHAVRVHADGSLLTLAFTGDGFLYKMVRLLTGSIIRVATGRAPLSWMEDLLRASAGRKSHFTAPADGLYLMRVDYPQAICPRCQTS